MDLTRRAQKPASLPESRRSSDIYRPVTTAAYSTPRPLVIGQFRVPTTVIRDGRKIGKGTGAAVDGVIHYGLCEGPIKAVGLRYADKGQQVRIGSVDGTAAHIYNEPFPWVGINAPTDATASPDSQSIEVSTEITLAGADSSYLYGGTGNDSGLTSYGLPNSVTESHACVTGQGDTAKSYAVLWCEQLRTLTLYTRTGSGAWSFISVLTSDSVSTSVRPAVGAVVQPHVAAVGSLVHVVWSILSQAAEPVAIAHAWSTNGGGTWTVGQNLVPQTKAGAAGVQRLQVALHSSGEVWVSCQKRSQVDAPNPMATHTSGVVVGYLPSTATASTAWILPDLTSRTNATGTKGELCIIDAASFPFPLFPASNLLRAPSVLPLGSGKATLSCVYSPVGVQQCQLYALPIKADTLVRWDLVTAAFNLVAGDTDPHSNVASLPWVNANGYSGKALGWAPDGTKDYRNEGSTQIMGLTATSFAVLYNHIPLRFPYDGNGGLASTLYYAWSSVTGDNWYATQTPANHPDRMAWGAWKLAWGSFTVSAVAWEAGTTDLSSTTSPAYMASGFFNGNGQIHVAMGMPSSQRGGTFECFSSPTLAMAMISTTTKFVTPWLSFFPSTAINNSVGYQWTALNGEALAIWREDEEIDTSKDNGLRLIVKGTGIGDILPSVICKRPLTGDRVRGLDIQWLQFDDEDGPNAGTSTWEAFDNYCEAMGIHFSLCLTSQQAAWPLVVDILESANAVPFRSQGLLKVFVRETATITGNGSTYTPKAEHAGPVATIPAAHLREPLAIEPEGTDAQWNRLTVNWSNRANSYSTEPLVIEDAGSVSRKGPTDASACDWPWITTPQTAMTCAWLRMRHRMRTGRTYSFAVDQRYMLLEPGDIVTVSDGQIPARTVRILRISEGFADWREIEAEDVVVSSTAVSPPGSSTSTTGTESIATPVNLPIIFVALIGGLLQVWILLSGGAGWRGCAVQQSWDGITWESVGTCAKQSPTGHLIQAMDRLRVRPGQRVHPGLRLGMADFAVADFSESASLPPWPLWNDYLAGNPGALLWVDGELLSYATESDDGQALAQCSVLRRGLYGTTCGQHPILSRVGAVTNDAFQWPLPPGSEGRTCYWRFPCPTEDPAAVTVYSVEIPA